MERWRDEGKKENKKGRESLVLLILWAIHRRFANFFCLTNVQSPFVHVNSSPAVFPRHGADS